MDEENKDYTDPIQNASAEENAEDQYSQGSAAWEAVTEAAKRKKDLFDKNMAETRERIDEQRRAEQQDTEDPATYNPFEDDSDYFGLTTTGKISGDLASFDELDGPAPELKEKEFYWETPAVKDKFIATYGEDNAEEAFDLLYAQVRKKHTAQVAEFSFMGRSAVNVAAFAIDVERQAPKFVASTAYQEFLFGAEKTKPYMTSEIMWANRGQEIAGDFYASERSSSEWGRDYYMDPDTNEIKLLTEEEVDKWEDDPEFIGFKHDAAYIYSDDEDRGPRFAQVLRRGDEVKASDIIISSWDLHNTWLANDGRENAWYETLLKAVPRFGVETGVGIAEAANNVLMVGSALVMGDDLTGTEWDKWLTKNDVRLRSSKMSVTDEARDHSYTSFDGLMNLMINVTSQFAAAYLTGGTAGLIGKAATGIKYGRVASQALKAGNLGRVAAISRSTAKLGMKAAKVGNLTSKSLMTAMAMGDLYQIGKENGLSNREAGGVAMLAFAGLWKVLSIGDKLWKPFELNVAKKYLKDVAQKSLSGVDEVLSITEKAAIKEGTRRGLVGKGLDKFVQKMKDNVLLKKTGSMVRDVGNFTTKNMPKIGKDAFTEGGEEVAELWAVESIKNIFSFYKWAKGDEVSAGKGRFSDVRDKNYFKRKMDESIESFIGGFLGGAMMGAVKGKRSPEQLDNLAQIYANGKVKDYTDFILKAYEEQDPSLFNAHDFIYTTKKAPDGEGYVAITQELRNEGVKTIAEIKRDLLFQEMNELQTRMELDGVNIAELEEKVDAGDLPLSVVEDYKDELKEYIAAVSAETDEVGTGPSEDLVSTAIPTTNEEGMAQAAATQEALAPERVTARAEAQAAKISGHVTRMNDIVNGLTILDNIKDDAIVKYTKLNGSNPLTNEKTLFDKLNAAQAHEVNTVNSNRKAQTERAVELNTEVLQKLASTNPGYKELLELLNTAYVETDPETGKIIKALGVKKLYQRDRDAIIQLLESKKQPYKDLYTNKEFVDKVREVFGNDLNDEVNKNLPGLYKYFNITQVSMDDPIQKLITKVHDFMVDRAAKSLNSMSGSVIGLKYKVANVLDPKIIGRMEGIKDLGDNFTEADIDEALKKLKDLANFAEQSGSSFTDFLGLVIDNKLVKNTEDLINEENPNTDITNIITQLNSIKTVDNEADPISAMDILNKKIIVSNNGEKIQIDGVQSLDDVVNEEAKIYWNTKVDAGDGIYTYNNASVPEGVIKTIEAQLESIQLTAELAENGALQNARMRSASIRKGTTIDLEDGSIHRQVGGITAEAHQLIAPYSIKESYDNFEDFFTNMYYDPLRAQHLESKEKLGTITELEKAELEKINHYRFSLPILQRVEQKILEESGGRYIQGFETVLINIIDSFNSEGILTISDEELENLKDIAANPPSTHIQDPDIPQANAAFSEALVEVLPAPVSQYLLLLQAKNDLTFFTEAEEANKNLLTVGLSLNDQNAIYNENFKSYSSAILKPLLEESQIDIPEETRAALNEMVIEMDIMMAPGEEATLKEEVNEELVAAKFQLERKFFKTLHNFDSNLKEAHRKFIISRIRGKDSHITSNALVALEFNIDNFYTIFKEVISNTEELQKMHDGAPDLLQENAARTVVGMLQSEATRGMKFENMMFVDGALATGKSTYTVGIALRIAQQLQPGYQIMFAANHKLQYDNIKKLGKDFKLDIYETSGDIDLIKLTEMLEDTPEKLKDVNIIVYDEATFIDVEESIQERKSEKAGHQKRFRLALEKINKNRSVPLKMVFVGDRNQLGYDSSTPRLGPEYADDPVTEIRSNGSSMGDITRPILRTQYLQAQYRATNNQIPAVIAAFHDRINRGTVSRINDPLNKNVEIETNWGYSKGDDAFIGVNVLARYSHIDDEYIEFLDRRFTQDPNFSFGIANDIFDISMPLEQNLEKIKEAPKLVELLLKHKDKTILLGSHADLQGQSLTFVIADVGKDNIDHLAVNPQTNNEDVKKMSTSVGRGIEHAIVITHNTLPLFTANKRNDSLRLTKQEIIQDYIKNTRLATLNRIGEDLETSLDVKPKIIISPTEEDQSEPPIDEEASPPDIITPPPPPAPLPPAPADETPPSTLPPSPPPPPIEEEGPIPPPPASTPPVPPDNDGWNMSKGELDKGNTMTKPLEDGSFLIQKNGDGGDVTLGFALQPDAVPEYFHAIKLGTGVIDGRRVTYFAKFKINTPSDVALNEETGQYEPVAGQYEHSATVQVVSTSTSYNKEFETTDVRTLEIAKAHIPALLEAEGFTIDTSIPELEVNKRKQAVNNAIKNERDKIRKKSAYDIDGDFANAAEATHALEDRGKKTPTKDNVLNARGVVSINKLVSDVIYKTTTGKTTNSRNNRQWEAVHILVQYKGQQQKINYELSKLFNAEVRVRVQNPENYNHKILIARTGKETTAHFVSVNKDGSDPIAISNFILADGYKTSEMFAPFIAKFDADYAETGPIDPNNPIYTEYDYPYSISLSDIAPGTAVDLESPQTMAQALNIIKYDDVFEDIRESFLTPEGAYNGTPIPADVLLTVLKSQGIHVYDDLLINMNTAEVSSGGVSLMFNQIGRNLETTPIESVISSKTGRNFDKTKDGRVGFSGGFGGIKLSSSAITITDALNMLLPTEEGQAQGETSTIKENFSIDGLLSQGKSIEMIELFATITSAINETMGALATSTKQHKNIQRILKGDEDSDGIRGHLFAEAKSTPVFTVAEIETLKSSLAAKYATEEGRESIRLLGLALNGMFNDYSLGNFKKDSNGRLVLQETPKPSIKKYAKDVADPLAPIQYIIPAKEDQSTIYPTVIFSLNKFIDYIQKFKINSTDPAGYGPHIAEELDNIMKDTKFKNGIYIKLDKKSESREFGKGKNYAVALPNKLPGQDNIHLMSTTSVSVSNPTFVLPLNMVSDALQGVIPEGVGTIQTTGTAADSGKVSKEALTRDMATKVTQVIAGISYQSLEDIREFGAYDDVLDNLIIYNPKLQALRKEFAAGLRTNITPAIRKAEIDDREDALLKHIRTQLTDKATTKEAVGTGETLHMFNITNLSELIDNFTMLTQKNANVEEKIDPNLLLLAKGPSLILTQKAATRAIDKAKRFIILNITNPALQAEALNMVDAQAQLWADSPAQSIEAIISDAIDMKTVFVENIPEPKVGGTLVPMQKLIILVTSLHNLGAGQSTDTQLEVRLKAGSLDLDTYTEAVKNNRLLKEYNVLLNQSIPKPNSDFYTFTDENWAMFADDKVSISTEATARTQAGNVPFTADSFAERMTDDSSFDADVIDARRDNPDFDITELAEKQAAKSARAAFIAGIIPHINSAFLLFNVQGNLRQQDGILAELDRVRKEAPDALPSIVGEYLADTKKKLAYLVTIDDMGSAKIKETVRTVTNALTILNSKLARYLTPEVSVVDILPQLDSDTPPSVLKAAKEIYEAAKDPKIKMQILEHIALNSDGTPAIIGEIHQSLQEIAQIVNPDNERNINGALVRMKKILQKSCK